MKRSKFVILSLASVMLAGCGGAEKLEDELYLLAGCEEPYMNAVADAFAAKYNVKVKRIRKSSGEIEAQIKNEKGTPSADVLFGGTTDPYNALKAESLLEK